MQTYGWWNICPSCNAPARRDFCEAICKREQGLLRSAGGEGQHVQCRPCEQGRNGRACLPPAGLAEEHDYAAKRSLRIECQSGRDKKGKKGRPVGEWDGDLSRDITGDGGSPHLAWKDRHVYQSKLQCSSQTGLLRSNLQARTRAAPACGRGRPARPVPSMRAGAKRSRLPASSRSGRGALPILPKGTMVSWYAAKESGKTLGLHSRESVAKGVG